MRSNCVVRASDSQCRSRNCPGFDPSILRHSGICGAADKTVLNKVHRKIKTWHRGHKFIFLPSFGNSSEVGFIWVMTRHNIARYERIHYILIDRYLFFCTQALERTAGVKIVLENMCRHAGFLIRIHLTWIRIQHFRLITDLDPIRIQSFMTKNRK